MPVGITGRRRFLLPDIEGGTCGQARLFHPGGRERRRADDIPRGKNMSNVRPALRIHVDESALTGRETGGGKI